MVLVKVIKEDVKDKETGKMLKVGDVADISLKRLEVHEKAHGPGYFERVKEEKDK